MQKLDSNIDDFSGEYLTLTTDISAGATPAAIMKKMRQVDDELKTEKELEKRLRSKWHFVSPQNRHRIKVNRRSAEYLTFK